MKTFIAFFIIFVSTTSGFSQEPTDDVKKYSFSSEIGVGFSRFEVVGAKADEYPSYSMRLAGNVSRTIFSKRLLIETGLGIFYRAKSKGYLDLERGYYYGKGQLILRLEQTAVRDHIAIELPLSIRYKISRGNSINAGMMVRFWQNERFIDLLANQTKLGFIAGIDQTVLPNLRIGIDIYLGLQDLYHGLDVGGGNIDIKTQSAYVSVSYDF